MSQGYAVGLAESRETAEEMRRVLIKLVDPTWVTITPGARGWEVAVPAQEYRPCKIAMDAFGAGYGWRGSVLHMQPRGSTFGETSTGGRDRDG